MAEVLHEMIDGAYLTAFSALAGSLVGGLATGSSTWLAQRFQVRVGQRSHERIRLEELYRDFIAAASKAYGDALLNSEPQLSDLIGLYAMIGRMRIASSPNVVLEADKVMAAIINTYAPSKVVNEVRGLIRRGAGIDPLKVFSEIARGEIEGIHLA